MKKEQINIRDPFVVYENEKYYLYGSRAKNFAMKSGGFDVYISNDLIEWSEPIECFSSEKYGLNIGAVPLKPQTAFMVSFSISIVSAP